MHRSKHALLKIVKAIGVVITLFVMYGSSQLVRGDDILQSEIVVHEDLSYSKEDPDLKMDLFLPRETHANVPCVVVIQGGGFRAQDGQRFRPFARYLAEHGFAAALIAYRGRPGHTYQSTISDTKAAVRYVRKISHQYSIDPQRIGAMGGSAGATLAVFLAVTGDMERFEGDGGHTGYSSRIQAAVAYAGVYDFVARYKAEQQIRTKAHVDRKKKTFKEWIGPAFQRNKQPWLDVSAINHVDKQDPAVLFMHGKRDRLVPWMQSRIMYERMKDAGVESRVVYYATKGHGFWNRDFRGHKRKMVRFFTRRLRGGNHVVDSLK